MLEPSVYRRRHTAMLDVSCFLVYLFYLLSFFWVSDPGIFKPPPPVGAGGGYMFSGRPSVPLSVRP